MFIKNLVNFYLEYQNYAAQRQWENWPFHNVYNYYTAQNGGIKNVDKWRNLLNSNMSEILAQTSFDDLINLLSDWAKSVPGIGTLQVYDTATCFLQPQSVHLSCGAREAAVAIDIKIHNGSAAYADFVAFDSELGRLTPLQLEDFLCINKKVFKKQLTPAAQLNIHQQYHSKSTSVTGCSSLPKPSKESTCRH